MIGEGKYLHERVSKQQHLSAALRSNSQQSIKRVQQNRKVGTAALLRPHDLSERTTKGLDGKGNGEEAVSQVSCPLSFSDAGQLLNRLLLLGGVSSSSKHSRCGSRTEPCATLNETCTALRTRLVPIPMLAWKVEREG